MAKQSIPSVRLNANIRKLITASVIEKTIWPLMVKLESQLDAVIEKIRLESVGGEANEKIIQEAINQVTRLNKKVGALGGHEMTIKCHNLTDYRMQVNVRGMHMSLYFYGKQGEFPGINWDRLAIYEGARYTQKICYATDYATRYVIKDEALIDSYLSLRGQIEKLEEEVKSVCLTVRGTLDSVTTLNKLREAWPECEEYLPANIENPSTQMKLNLPVSIDALNKKLTSFKKAA